TMLIQPFVENAIEHAFKDQKDQKEIVVTIEFKEDRLLCSITDNGIGINQTHQVAAGHKNSLATTITSERLKILSKSFNTPGSIQVTDRTAFGEQGTQVSLIIPYKTNSN
ncbi:MAG: ATP-binding protein, partial [Bacteroidota bacterium]